MIMKDETNKKNQFTIADRIKLKRQTKLICPLHSNWNNYNKLSELLSYGVDGIEINSEINSEIKKEMIAKVNYFSKEYNLHIPIIVNLSFYRVFVKQIRETDEDEVKIKNEEIVYIVNSRSTLNKINSKERKSSKGSEILEKNYESNTKQAPSLVSLISLSKQMRSLKEEKQISENRELSIITEPPINSASFSPKMNIHINYGDVSLEVLEVGDGFLKCVSKNSGVILKHSAISVESEDHFAKGMFEINEIKLVQDIEDAVKLGATYIIISVSKNAKEEIKQIKELLEYHDASHVGIIVRLDSADSIFCFDDFLDFIDVVYFSRNDLLLKDSPGKLCYNQKAIVNKCNFSSKKLKSYK